MKIAVMQPYCFPYIGYFQLIKAVDKFVIYDDVGFINRGWINRNNILVNGSSYLFTIPLEGASQNRKINEINIHTENKWRVKFLKTIEMSYAKSPCFHEVYEMLRRLIMADFRTIAEFNLASIRAITSYLNIETNFVVSSSRYCNTHLNGQKRIIDICLKEEAKEYINPIGGEGLYKAEEFIKSNLILRFIKTTDFRYSQFDNKFVPYLSIIDILMFNSKDDLARILECHELI
jgi:hypothetical protein